MAGFLEALRTRVVLGDGAMGTELRHRQPAFGTPIDHFNLICSDLVREVHRDYRAAGAEVLKTNTFTANRIRLRSHSLEAETREINLAGARLAREASEGRAHILGSVGPLSDRDLTREESGKAYEEQCRALAEGGCDGLLLETFTDLPDLRRAVSAARATGLPVVAQVALKQGMEEVGADVVGINCLDPEEALGAIRSIRGTLLSCSPSAGLPELGRYPVSPDAFAAGAGRLVELGVRLIGGCCGTTPAHIRALARRLGR